MKVLFLDESGDHSLEVIDAQYPVFVLAGVIMDAEYHRKVLRPRVRTFKREVLGDESIILHTADIVRARKGFERLRDPQERTRFYSALNTLMREPEYKVVACAIQKQEHLDRYGPDARDPYHYSLDVLVERFVYELQPGEERGMIVAECRHPDLDAELRNAWQAIRIDGTRFVSADAIARRITDLILREKKQGDPGIEFADLVASPIGRYTIGLPEKEDFRIVREKFRRVEGKWEGCGYVRLPSGP